MPRPYILYGSSKLSSLNAMFKKQVDHWLKEWGSEKDNSVIVCVLTESIRNDDSQKMYSACYGDGESKIVISIDKMLYISFPDLIMPLKEKPGSPHSDVVSDILNKVFFDLLKPYLKYPDPEITAPVTLRNDHVIDLDVAKNTGDVVVKIEFSQGSIYLQLPYSVIYKLNDYTCDIPSNRQSLINRKNCLIPGDVKLVVNIGGTEVDFGSVVDMQVGDVIRLNSKISDKMQIETYEGDFICDAHLGKQGNNKAIKVII